jgi:hypothetical protein
MRERRREPLSSDEFELEFEELFELHGSDDVFVLVFVDVFVLVFPASAGVANVSMAAAIKPALKSFIGLLPSRESLHAQRLNHS